MYTIMNGYNMEWSLGEKNILLVSVGTGIADPKVESASLNLAALQGINALKSLMQDCSVLQEIILQWMSQSDTKRKFDREMGDLSKDLIGGQSQLSYLRYNSDLSKKGVEELNPNIPDESLIKSLSEMDSPKNMGILFQLGERAAAREVKPEHFPNHFKLT